MSMSPRWTFCRSGCVSDSLFCSVEAPAAAQRAPPAAEVTFASCLLMSAQKKLPLLVCRCCLADLARWWNLRAVLLPLPDYSCLVSFPFLEVSRSANRCHCSVSSAGFICMERTSAFSWALVLLLGSLTRRRSLRHQVGVSSVTSATV